MLLNRLLLVAAQRGNGAKWWRSQAQDRQLLGARPQERHHRGSAGRMGCSRGPAPWFCTPQRAPIWPIDSPALWQSMLMSCARPLLYTDSAANESTDRSWYQRQGMLNLERAGAARGEQRGARDGAKGGHWVTRGVNRGGCLKRGRFALAGGEGRPLCLRHGSELAAATSGPACTLGLPALWITSQSGQHSLRDEDVVGA